MTEPKKPVTMYVGLPDDGAMFVMAIITSDGQVINCATEMPTPELLVDGVDFCERYVRPGLASLAQRIYMLRPIHYAKK